MDTEEEKLKRVEEIYQEFLGELEKLEQKRSKIIADYRKKLEEVKIKSIRQKLKS